MAKGKTYQSGIGVSAERRSPLAPGYEAMLNGPGIDVLNPSGDPERGKLIPKMGRAAAEPAGATAVERVQNYERHGARLRVVVPRLPPQSPESYATQANGRIVPSYPKLQELWSGANFWDASQGL